MSDLDWKSDLRNLEFINYLLIRYFGVCHGKRRRWTTERGLRWKNLEISVNFIKRIPNILHHCL